MNPDFSGESGALLDECVSDYESFVGDIDAKARAQSERSYGGMVRMGKGRMVENVVRKLLRVAWLSLGRAPARLEFNLHSKYEIWVRPEYVEKIADANLRREMRTNIGRYKIRHGADIHVHIDKDFVLSVECKAFTENAMLKRILFDAFLLGTRFPGLRFALVQLESQLGGDYGSADPEAAFGSPQSHTLMSHMDSVNLHVITLLEGDRKVDEPIHKPEFYKPLSRGRLEKAAAMLANLLDGAKPE